MSIDVTAELEIACPPEAVAAYAFDPDNDPTWIGGITEASLLTDRPVGLETQVSRIAWFLGKKIEYILEVRAFEPNKVMHMESLAGPFGMKVTYRFEPSDSGTHASIRIQGDTTGFFSLAAPVMGRLVQRSVAGDLANLKAIVEG